MITSEYWRNVLQRKSRWLPKAADAVTTVYDIRVEHPSDCGLGARDFSLAKNDNNRIQFITIRSAKTTRSRGRRNLQLTLVLVVPKWTYPRTLRRFHSSLLKERSRYQIRLPRQLYQLQLWQDEVKTNIRASSKLHSNAMMHLSLLPPHNRPCKTMSSLNHLRLVFIQKRRSLLKTNFGTKVVIY